MNLLSNAIHHHRPGGEIRLRSGVENGASFLLVTDNGPGIAPEHLPHIFERFYRADATRGGTENRFGLGLAICQDFVAAEGGTITAESELGAGTTFALRFPNADSAERPSAT